MIDGLPVVTTILSGVCTLGVGMTLAYIRDIKQTLNTLNGKVFTHITNPGIHESAVARTDEQVKALTHAVAIAHERIDSLKGRG